MGTKQINQMVSQLSYPSLRATNWERKIRNKVMSKVFQLLKIKGYILEKNGTLYYNKMKAMPPLKLAKEIKKISDSLSLSSLKASNEFTANLPILFPLVITLREIVPTEMIKRNSPGKQYEIWKRILGEIPICAIPSTDRFASFGMIQMVEDTYNRLKRNHFPSLIDKEFHKCLDYECQIKVAFLLTYSNLNMAWRFLKKKRKFMEVWSKASQQKKREFVVYIASLMLNAGFSRSIRKVLDDVFINRKNEFYDLNGAMKILSWVSDWKMRNNDSGTYARNVVNFYNYLKRIPAYSQYNRAAFSSSKRTLNASRNIEIEIERGGSLKTKKRKSKRTGRVYDCYILTINGKGNWNEKMLKALMRNPSERNINLILGFNGMRNIKELRGTIAIPEQFFDKSIGREFVVVENKWKTYKDIVKHLTNAKNEKEIERYRAVLYALNNSAEARNLKRVRIPVKLLKVR